MKTITLEMIPNTVENRESLECGDGYIVAFDNGKGEIKIANAIWRSPRFCFPALAFWPEMKDVTSWCHITGLDLSDLEQHAD